MYFLNGNRVYIKPKNGHKSLEEQLQNCFSQLSKINSGKEVFKVNFFADISSDESYHKLKDEIKSEVIARFSPLLITSVIAQPPLTCKIIAEAFYYDTSLWKLDYIEMGKGSAAVFKREETEILVGNVQVDNKKYCRENAFKVFSDLKKIFDQVGFPVNSIIRQWNYVEDILGFDGEKQRYQEFNNVRSVFYGDHFKETGYPAATGIGMNHGGVLIEFVALQSATAKTLPLNNPGQIAAHGYSKKVLIGKGEESKTTPKFERARFLELFNRKMIFISGTASIRGENTLGVDDPSAQTKVTIENIERLYSPEVLNKIPGNKPEPKYEHARVYVKKREDFPGIKRVVESYYGSLPVVYILADICRDNLLVEIEGKVILD